MIERGPEPSTRAPGYTVTVRGLVLMCSIGIRRHEREHRQRVRVSVDLVAAAAAGSPGDDRRRVINYEKVVAAIHEIARSGHIDLCEGFAERICAACFADPRVERVRVWVEKLDVFSDAEGVGAILERARPAIRPGEQCRLLVSSASSILLRIFSRMAGATSILRMRSRMHALSSRPARRLST